MSFVNCKLIGADMSYESYHDQTAKRGDKDYSMSRSELVTFAQCPSKWIAGFKSDDDATPSTDWGSMIDCLLTSPAKFEAQFAVSPEFYEAKGMQCPGCKTITDSKKCKGCGCDREEIVIQKDWNANATICTNWANEREGKTIIKSHTKTDADLAVSTIKANAIAAELFSVSQKQVMVIGFWKDRLTGVSIPIRILIDLVPPKGHALFGKWLADFKTARNGNPAGWAKVVDDCGYDVQAALYFDLYCAATNEDRTDFVHVVQENIAPFHVVTPLPAMTTEFLAYGRAKYQSALGLYAQCIKTGIWPSYAPAGREMFGLQYIGPDDLWTYKKNAGGVGRMEEYKPEPAKHGNDTTERPTP